MFEERDRTHDLYGLYEGAVTDNKDPERAGRIRCIIPGLIEPQSGWIMPVGSSGAGSKARGHYFVPAIGSNIALLFKEGDIDHPRYLTGPWPFMNGSHAPTFATELSASDAPQVSGMQTSKWEIVLDDRPGFDRLTISHRDFPANSITIDGATQALEVSGTIAVQIKSMGVVNIEGLQVVINGRPVLPGTKPI